MDHPWRQPTLRVGVETGILAAALFLTAHHFLVQPIWWVAAPRAAAVVLVAGPVAAWALRRDVVVAHRGGAAAGAAYGARLIAPLGPIASAGLLISLSAHPAQVAGLLALSLALVFVVLCASLGYDKGRVGCWALAYVVLNGYPSVFLLQLGNLVEQPPPEPFAMLAAYAMIILAAGAYAGHRMTRLQALGPSDEA